MKTQSQINHLMFLKITALDRDIAATEARIRKGDSLIKLDDHLHTKIIERNALVDIHSITNDPRELDILVKINYFNPKR